MDRLLALIAITVSGVVLVAASHDDYTKESRENFSRTLSAAKTLDVDNVSGFVEVDGDGGNGVRVEGEKIIRAISDSELERAKREVTLDINEKDGVLQLYANGPFRRQGEPFDYHGFHLNNDREYQVTFNLTVHVPRRMELTLRTVNGPVRTNDTAGHFDIHAVNGGITMARVAGSGSIQAVNGAITASFRENPKEATRFDSVNGRISATFLPGLAADIRYKTLNGGVFTDFDATPVASSVERDSTNGRLIFRRKNDGEVRIGTGGPELDFKTVNGSIEIHKQTN